MSKKNEIKLFEQKQVRSIWNADQEKWYMSIVDVIAVLTESIDPNAYWRKLKQRLKEEGNETVTNCHGLKMMAADGKMRLTDVADAEQIFRLIQSIPSPKAEPFKLWLAQVASERLDDNMTNTELILSMLAEASTKDISEATKPSTFDASKKVAKQGGNVAKVALKELESKTGKKVVSSLNAKNLLGIQDSQPKKKISSAKKKK
jgi:hypothetical protein